MEFPLGWALTSLMKKGGHDPIKVGKQAAEKLNTAKITDLNRVRLLNILDSYLQGTEDQINEVRKMWRIDPAPKLVPDHESYLDILVRERDEARTTVGLEKLQNSVKRLIRNRFGEEVALAFNSNIDSISEENKLDQIFDTASTATSVEELRKVIS